MRTGLGREGELALDSGLAVRQPTTTTPRGVNSLGSDGGERSLGVAYLVVVASVNQRSREDDLVRLGPGGEIKLRGRGENGPISSIVTCCVGTRVAGAGRAHHTS